MSSDAETVSFSNGGTVCLAFSGVLSLFYFATNYAYSNLLALSFTFLLFLFEGGLGRGGSKP